MLPPCPYRHGGTHGLPARHPSAPAGRPVTAILHAMSSAHAASLMDPGWWLGSLGAIGIFAVLFAETGLFVGFFLPGDSLLFTAGALCAATPARLSPVWVLLAAFAGAVCGAQAGYLIGRRAGVALNRSTRIPHLSRAATRGGRMLSRFGVGRTWSWPASSRSCAPSSTPWPAPSTSRCASSPSGRSPAPRSGQ
jgi:membrane protein YqaA with SNARE-associated domain